MCRRASRAPALLLLVALVLAGGCRKREKEKAPAAPTKAPPVKILYPTAPGSFVKLVARLGDSVVHLRTDVPVRGGPADWFPGTAVPQSPLAGDLTERMQRSLGSGFIIDVEGHVLTNAHVVSKADKIRVQLNDGTDVAAKIVGKDESTDIALLRFEPPMDVKLSPVRLGDSDQLQPGEWVVALGDPFGMGPTVTAGVVSSRERQGGALGQLGLWSYLQTDAAISPGNSGGPLCNVIGEVVGIATAVEPEARGVGFAVPITLAQKILPMLRRDGRVVRVWIGIRGVRVTEEKAKEVGLKRPRGTLVTAVLPRGPAERAGLRVDDIITSFDRKDVVDGDELPWIATMAGVDRLVPVKVWRNGKTLSFSLKTEPMPQ
jgi:serine protease Do